jgi:aryl-alcohol dehydrogenase-like predicted oxidoreductase
MQYKYLGNSNLKIPAIGQGCMGVGGYFNADTSQDEHFIRMLRAGIESNLTFLDTAEAYGAGHSEILVGQAIQGQRDRVVVATKVSPEHLSYSDLLQAAEGSLRRLQTDYIDLYQVHWPNPRIPILDTMSAMARLIRERVIRHIGVSNFSVHNLQAAQAALPEDRIQALQVEYNLFDRTIEKDLLPYCEQESITTIAYTPLDKGLLMTQDRRRDKIQELADKYHKTPAQLILKWLASHPAVIAIPKAASLAHIIENAQAVDFDLPSDDFDAISRLFNHPCVFIPTDRIQADSNGLDQFVPGPNDLAEAIRQGEPLKPIRVMPAKGQRSSHDYVLIEGKLRYWAWVIAHDGKKPIPTLIRGDK